MEKTMSDKEVNWESPREPVRDPKEYPGYPPPKVRDGIRQWGSADDWQLWQEWEKFIRGETDVLPESLADWLPDHELVKRERKREAEELDRRRKARLNQRAEFVMREQIGALKDALGKGYVRSPLVFAHRGYPGPTERAGKAKGMWGAAAWRQHHQAYAEAWERFMTGKTEKPPQPRVPDQPAGWAVELENKGYIGSDPPEVEGEWLRGKDHPDLPGSRRKSDD
jgi:hypothetical protein